MQRSETIKLYSTKEQETLIQAIMLEYISTVNSLVSDATNGTNINKYTSSNVEANLPSALKNQCIRDAKSIVKKPCCYVNNQNFKIKNGCVEFPVMVNGKSKRIAVKTKMSEKQQWIFDSHKLGTMRIVVKNNTLVAQIVYESAEPEIATEGNILGVDLGIKCPAVSYCSDGSVQFYGNGRQNKYMRRHYRYLRKKLQKKKHLKAVKRMNDKEQRIMKDIDHKISSQIVKTAVKHKVNIIKLERLQNIRSTTRTSRKNNPSLHTWSFYRLAQFIEYKAKLAGIQVAYVNPAYTSQKCPVCGDTHHANDRQYTCDCGFHIHRDLLGAMNICNSTEFVGNRQTA